MRVKLIAAFALVMSLSGCIAYPAYYGPPRGGYYIAPGYHGGYYDRPYYGPRGGGRYYR